MPPPQASPPEDAYSIGCIKSELVPGKLALLNQLRDYPSSPDQAEHLGKSCHYTVLDDGAVQATMPSGVVVIWNQFEVPP